MQPSPLAIATEGWPVIGLCALSAIVFAIVGCWPMAVIFLVFTWFSCHFFRDPERVIPQDESVAVSPADGKIIRIEQRTNPLTNKQCQCISIFMNVFNVHVNRSPVTAHVAAIQYWPGKFVNAALDKASTDNERCGYLLKDKDGLEWGMMQIAGLIAQRIVCRTQQGASLTRGERYGLIRFGSRVDLYLPEEYSPCVGIGEKVFAGQSIVAHRHQ